MPGSHHITWHGFEARDALAGTLACKLAGILAEAISTRGAATLVVSGGRTPVGLFRALRQSRLDWSRVTVVPADERWVDETDAASNARLIRTELLAEGAAAATFVSLKTPHDTPHAGQTVCGARLAELGIPLDAVVLGMGTDGHTASLFPDAPELAAIVASQDACAGTTPASQPMPRMTLTPVMLNAARHRFLHIEGDDKRSVLEAALAGDDALALPVRLVAHAAGAPDPLQVYWAP